MAVVDIFVGRVGHTVMLHLCPACLQVAVPELVAGAWGQAKDSDWSVMWSPQPFALPDEANAGRRGLGTGDESQHVGIDGDIREGVLIYQGRYTQWWGTLSSHLGPTGQGHSHLQGRSFSARSYSWLSLGFGAPCLNSM